MENYHSGRLTWVQSEGGPLLLLPNGLLGLWGGAFAIEVPGPSPVTFCDYNRACQMKDTLGLVQVGSGEGLVLGDVPDMTSWWPLSRRDRLTGMLVRWGCAEGEAEVLKALEHVPRSLWKPDGIRFEVKESLCLMDSACPGSRVKEKTSLLIDLPVGAYSVLTAHYRPDERTELTLHAFLRMPNENVRTNAPTSG